MKKPGPGDRSDAKPAGIPPWLILAGIFLIPLPSVLYHLKIISITACLGLSAGLFFLCFTAGYAAIVRRCGWPKILSPRDD